MTDIFYRFLEPFLELFLEPFLERFFLVWLLCACGGLLECEGAFRFFALRAAGLLERFTLEALDFERFTLEALDLERFTLEALDLERFTLVPLDFETLVLLDLAGMTSCFFFFNTGRSKKKFKISSHFF